MSQSYWGFSGYGVNLDDISSSLLIETSEIHDELLENEGSTPLMTLTTSEADKVIFNALKPFLKEGTVLLDIMDSFEHFSAVGCG